MFFEHPRKGILFGIGKKQLQFYIVNHCQLTQSAYSPHHHSLSYINYL